MLPAELRERLRLHLFTQPTERIREHVQTLGLDWSEVHDEAERLEHAISDKLLDKIDAALGHHRAGKTWTQAARGRTRR